jgi:hypothetical protein
MHGKGDEDIPISHSEELYRNLNTRKKGLKVFENGKHGD